MALRKSKGRVEFDHLNLDDDSRALIRKACDGANRVELAPLDKGLSGSSVWLARWELASGVPTQHHVFKIGARRKLKRENDAMTIASSIVKAFPHFHLYTKHGSERALLKQQFAGDVGRTASLRQVLQDSADPARASALIKSLYVSLLHGQGWLTGGKKVRARYEHILDWWVERMDLPKAANAIGAKAIDRSLRSSFRMKLDGLQKIVRAIRRKTEAVPTSPVHGDLHAQNVLVDADDQLHLIDYGWTAERWPAIDFLMMECSLKFVVSPPHATLEDLIRMETIIDTEWERRVPRTASLQRELLGAELETIAAAVIEVRRCARDLQAVENFAQYRHGLILLTAALATLPSLINRVYLFHSLAYYAANE